MPYAWITVAASIRSVLRGHSTTFFDKTKLLRLPFLLLGPFNGLSIGNVLLSTTCNFCGNQVLC